MIDKYVDSENLYLIKYLIELYLFKKNRRKYLIIRLESTRWGIGVKRFH